MGYEQDARAAQTFEELKDVIVAIASEMDNMDLTDYTEYKEHERVAERVSFIENCFEDNKKLLNLDSLRL